MPERLPRTARAVNPVEAPGDLVEINLCLFPAAGDDAFQVDLVMGVVGQFVRAANRELDEFASSAAGLRIQFVERPFAIAPRLDQIGIQQQTEMRRDPRLSAPRDSLKLV